MPAVNLSYVCLAEMLDGLLGITGFHSLLSQSLLAHGFAVQVLAFHHRTGYKQQYGQYDGEAEGASHTATD